MSPSRCDDRTHGVREYCLAPEASNFRAPRRQLIYVSERLDFGLCALRRSRALTIGEEPDFLREGEIIHLYTESDRLRFAISVVNAKRAGLTISSNLLKLATHVDQGSL